ncbi:MAG: flagellar basal body P-ring formation protein FlgA [Nevskiaceae bacterium]|nr:MAG: flagellar basal body P-ring formation protein FlgA [Nevskiaceae bacterium]
MSRVLLILLLMLSGVDVRAAESPDWESAERIRALAREYAQRQAPAGARIEVSALDDRLRLPACAQTPEAFLPGGSAGSGALSVGVRCAAPVAWSLYVPVRISQMHSVAVLTRALAPGETVTADALTLQERDGASLPYGFITDPTQAVGKTLRRPLAAGAVLTPDAVAAVRVIRRGQSVTLLGRSGGVEVRMAGIAQGDAGVGDRLQVQNTSSRRMVEGTVRSADTVEVGL